MSRAKWFVAGGLMLGLVGLVAAGPIEDIMLKCHKAKTGLRAQIKTESEKASPNWADIQKKTKEFVTEASMIEKNSPPKGDAASWKKLSQEYVAQVKQLDAAAGKKDAKGIADVDKKLGANCKGCHDAHKEE